MIATLALLALKPVFPQKTGFFSPPAADAASNAPASNDLLSVAIDHAGRVFFGTNGAGVSMWDRGTWTTLTPSNTVSDTQPLEAPCPPGRLVTDTVQAMGVGPANQAITFPSGRMWFGTPGSGISTFNQRGWAVCAHNSNATKGPADNDVTAIVVASSYGWFGTRHAGLSRFRHTASYGTWRTYTTADGLVSNDIRALDAQSDAIWVGTAAGVNILHYVNGQWTADMTYTVASGLGSSNVTSLAHSGSVWWIGLGPDGAHPGGVTRFDGATWQTYTTANGLADNHVNAVAVDNSGTVWVGTDAGVSAWNGSVWTTYTSASTSGGLGANKISGIAVAADNGKWFATRGGGAGHFDGSGWQSFNLPHPCNYDFDHSGAVGLPDIQAVGQSWHTADASILLRYDQNYDGVLDVQDVAATSGQYGQSCP